MAITTDGKVSDVVEAIVAAHNILRDAGTIPPAEIPPAEWVGGTIRHLFTDRPRSKRDVHPLRLRSSVKSDAPADARALFGLLKWHRSGGDLTGLMIAQWTAAHWQWCDTTASTLLAITGSRSSAADAWRRTGLVG